MLMNHLEANDCKKKYINVIIYDKHEKNKKYERKIKKLLL